MTKALQAAGYEQMPELAPGVNQRTEYHISLTGGPGQRIGLELHWRLVAGREDWRSPPMDWFLSRAEQYGSHALQLSPTDNLLYLAVHLMLQHGAAEARLIWFYDLHLLITSEPARLDWDTVVERAAAWRWSVAVHAALQGTVERFGTSVPNRVLVALEAAIDPQAAEFVQRKTTMRPTPVASEWLKLRTLRSGARLHFICSLVWPSPAYLRWRYRPHPDWLWPLWYGLHWIRLLSAAGSIGWRVIRSLRRSVPNAEQSMSRSNRWNRRHTPLQRAGVIERTSDSISGIPFRRQRHSAFTSSALPLSSLPEFWTQISDYHNGLVLLQSTGL